jgi:putative spermidine/putrescine transport system ATP-binding protein
MAYLELENVTKYFGTSLALKNISLSVEKGEFVSILGGSGCGKTTTLRIIAGFEKPSTGRVILNGQDISSVPPEKRELGFVFQHYALFPNMTVHKNIAFGLKGIGLSHQEIDTRVAELLTQVRMSEFANRYPRQLSGGQQQRVALARALARKPRVLLLDEPLSALDAKIRIHLRGEIRNIQRQLGVTTVYVTHDQEEALSLSDRVILLKDGEVEQIGSPSDLYNHPRNKYAADFIGTTNSLVGILEEPTTGTIRIGSTLINLKRNISGLPPQKLTILLRPENIFFQEEEELLRLPGLVKEHRFLGAVIRSVVEIEGAEGKSLLYVDSLNNSRTRLPELAKKVDLYFSAQECTVA